MKLKVVAVGRLKEKYLVQGITEYAKRLRRFAELQLVEVKDEKAPEQLSSAQMEQIKQKEGERILSKISPSEHVFALVIEGGMVSSVELAQKIDRLGIAGKSELTFVIGGSLGLSEAVLQRSNEQLSFGKLTFPHQLMRLILLEQIYRSFTIRQGHPYHK